MTYQDAQPPQTRCSKWWRDLPPHKDLPAQNSIRSDSPDWRAPSPNRPASFRSPSPPPQSPPAPPTSPLCRNIPTMPQKIHTENQLTFELVSLVKTTSETLQHVVHIAERLIRQVNTERRLAHKPWRTPWSSRGDARGNALCPQPPAFPSGRGVPVTGSLGGSDPIA